MLPLCDGNMTICSPSTGNIALITHWLSQIQNSSSGINYRIFKTNFGFGISPNKTAHIFHADKNKIHRLPIETGSWQSTARRKIM